MDEWILWTLQTVFENIVRKEEIACNEQFLLFPQCFLLNQIIVSPFAHIFDIISLVTAEFEEPKISILGKGLTSITPNKTLPNNGHINYGHITL